MKAIVVATVLVLGWLVGAPAAQAAEARLLVDAASLQARLADPTTRIVDMTTDPEDYHKGHVPGAIYLNVNDARIAVPAGGFRLPTAEEGAALLTRLGIDRETHVVIYDDTGGLNAARLFFTLDVFGHRHVALLDGGIQAWRRAGYAVAHDTPVVSGAGYVPTVDATRVASAEWMAARLGARSVRFVDARSPAEYDGIDRRAKRGGHVPGAVNIEWRQNLDARLMFKPADELRAMYVAHGITPERTIVTYCQTHHRAALDYFVLRLLGYPQVVGYDRSWIEWGNRDDLPVEP